MEWISPPGFGPLCWAVWSFPSPKGAVGSRLLFCSITEHPEPAGIRGDNRIQLPIFASGWWGLVGFAPVNSQPKAELVSAGNGHSPLFSMNTQKMELPSLLLQVRDSQLFPGPGWGQEDGEAREGEERHLHGGAQASTRTSQPLGTKFSGCLKAWSWAVEIECFSIDFPLRSGH